MKLNHQKMEFKVIIAQKKNLNSVILSITSYYFEILSVYGAEIMQQGSIMLFPISDSSSMCCANSLYVEVFSIYSCSLSHPACHAIVGMDWISQYIMHYLD